MSAQQQTVEYRVLLVSNYRPDQQHSMQRFASQLYDGLKQDGVIVDIFYPPTLIGRLYPASKTLGKWLGYIDKYLLSPLALKWQLRKNKQPTIVHICDHSNAHYTWVLRNTPHLITCHDLLAVRSALGEFEANRPGWTGRQQQAIILNGLRRCRHIAAVSQATADDATRIINQPLQQVSVIPNALDTPFIQAAQSPASTTSRPKGLLPFPAKVPYLLSVGSNAWYKNRTALLRIFAAMRSEHPDLQLVIVGPAFDKATLAANNCEVLRTSIHVLHDVSDIELCELYRAAELLLFPSLIEGFGWPILEAQACDCAVMTLDRAPMNTLNALPELCISNDLQTDAEIHTAAKQCLNHLQLAPENLTLKKATISRYATNFNNAASSSAYQKLYQEIFNRSA